MGILKYVAGLLYSNDKLVSVVGETAENGGIESGSNANGYWVKYPDGTLICHGAIVQASVPFTIASGSLFRNASTDIAITFATPFIATPEVTLNFAQSTVITVINPYNLGTATMNAIGYSTASITVTPMTVRYIAIGRWK